MNFISVRPEELDVSTDADMFENAFFLSISAFTSNFHCFQPLKTELFRKLMFGCPPSQTWSDTGYYSSNIKQTLNYQILSISWQDFRKRPNSTGRILRKNKVTLEGTEWGSGSAVRVNWNELAECREGQRGQKMGKTLVESWLQVKTMKVKAGM